MKNIGHHVILLPGLDGTGKLFEPFLAAAHRAFAAKPLAYPTQLANYNELEPVIRDQLTDHCVILAESFSGPLGLRVARDPRVAALILCNSFVAPPCASWLRHLAIGPLFCVPPPGWLLRRSLLGNAAAPELVDKIRDAIGQVPGAVLARRLRQVLSCGEQEILSSLRKPVLYLRGSDDALVSPRSWRAIQSLCPDAHLADPRSPSAPASGTSGLLESDFAVSTHCRHQGRIGAMNADGAPPSHPTVTDVSIFFEADKVTVRLRNLDWDTSIRAVRMADHWRLLTCVAVGSVLSTVVWHALFPHTHWFDKLWVGFATGATAAMLPGIYWQLRDEKRRPITSGRFIVVTTLGWGAFAVLSLVFGAPDFRSQEHERSKVRALTASEISAIAVRFDDNRSCRIEDAATISSLVDLTKGAELFYPSQEGSIAEFQLTIERTDGTSLTYSGRIPERHQSDLSLRFRGSFAWHDLLLPGGRQWFNAVIPRRSAIEEEAAAF